MPSKLQGIVLYSTKEASERLQRKPRTIQKWCREGTLKATKYGNEYLISAESLDQFLANILSTNGVGSPL